MGEHSLHPTLTAALPLDPFQVAPPNGGDKRLWGRAITTALVAQKCAAAAAADPSAAFPELHLSAAIALSKLSLVAAATDHWLAASTSLDAGVAAGWAAIEATLHACLWVSLTGSSTILNLGSSCPRGLLDQTHPVLSSAPQTPCFDSRGQPSLSPRLREHLGLGLAAMQGALQHVTSLSNHCDAIFELARGRRLAGEVAMAETLLSRAESACPRCRLVRDDDPPHSTVIDDFAGKRLSTMAAADRSVPRVSFDGLTALTAAVANLGPAVVRATETCDAHTSDGCAGEAKWTEIVQGMASALEMNRYVLLAPSSLQLNRLLSWEASCPHN